MVIGYCGISKDDDDDNHDDYIRNQNTDYDDNYNGYNYNNKDIKYKNKITASNLVYHRGESCNPKKSQHQK